MTASARLRFVALGLTLLAPAGGQVAGQGPPTGQVGPRYRLQAVSPHAHGTAVAVALRFPAGSQDDQEGFEGTAWLLGRVLEDQANQALDAAEAVVTASVGRSSTVFTLLALPEAWDDAWARVDSIIFQAPVDAAALERHRAGQLSRMTFEAGSPYREFEADAAGILADPGSPFTRPIQGRASSLAIVSTQTLTLYRNTFFRRDAAARALVGPLPGEPPPPTTDTPPTHTGMAWLSGRRTARVQDVTSTWIAAAYPAPASLPRTHLELVAHLLEEALDPTPPPPDLYGLDVRIEETPGGPVLVVEASVYPEASSAWETRILNEVRRLAGEPQGEDFFRWRRRRFRTARLLEEAAPEVEARRITEDLLRDGRPRSLAQEVWSLDARDLQAAARALGEPRILLLGPDLGSHGQGSP